MKEFPFKETKNRDHLTRIFESNVDEMELVWHRDKEDRLVESIEQTDWMIQIDGELPKSLNEKVFIPKEVYHRVIKGTGNLKVKIIKYQCHIKKLKTICSLRTWVK